MWPSAVITAPGCRAARADPENLRLYLEFPWGPAEPPLLNSFPASSPLLS